MNIDYMNICRKYEKEFFHDMAVLNVIPPTARMRVTEHIPQVIRFIQQLINKGLAYETSDGNCFSYIMSI